MTKSNSCSNSSPCEASMSVISWDPADLCTVHFNNFICESTVEYKLYAVVRVLTIECMMQSMQAFVIPNIYCAYILVNCNMCIHTTWGESTSSHQLIMGAVLLYAAVWRLVHSQWISSSMGSVIKVNSRPLQLCNRTLQAEQARRSFLSISEVLDDVTLSAWVPLMLQVKLCLPLGRFLNSRRQMLPGKMRALARFLKGACCSSLGSVVSRSLSPCVYLQNTSGDSAGAEYLQSILRWSSSFKQ